MQLREYLYQKRQLIKDFAKEIDYDRNTIHLMLNGKRKPGRKLIARIERATNGEVTADDLLIECKENDVSNTN